jgi:hypothetical protein
MTEKRTPNAPQRGTVGNDLYQGAIGGEPMTGVQRSYLHTLAQKAGQPVDDSLTRAQANKRIEELHAMTGQKFSTATSEEELEREDEGVLDSLGRAISAPVLDAHDAASPESSPSGPDGHAQSEARSERSPGRSAGEENARPRDPGSRPSAG